MVELVLDENLSPRVAIEQRAGGHDATHLCERGRLGIGDPVEDELTTIPFDPDAWQTDGRMYPPQADARRAVSDDPDVARYRSRTHNTYVRQNGAFEIQTTTGEVLVSRPGLDGKGVWS